MKESINTLKITNLELEARLSKNFTTKSAKLYASIIFRCPMTEETFKFVNIYAESTGAHSDDACLRECIEKFANGIVTIKDINVFDVKTECIPDNKHIHNIDLSSCREPFLSLFKDLFSKENWYPTTQSKLLTSQKLLTQ